MNQLARALWGKQIWFVFGLLLLLCSTVLADTPPLWGDLVAGPHGVGFRTIEKYDFSRYGLPKFDYFGTPLPGERARRIQTLIWYPAAVDASATPMSFGEYLFPSPDDQEFFRFVSLMQQRYIGQLFGMVGNAQGPALDALSIAVAAVRDAIPAEGRFPLLVYHNSLQAPYFDNLVLCEYLASHGFVVVATHSLGAAGFPPEMNQADLETAVRDRECATAEARQLPFVDAERIGVIGLGNGGFTAQVMQMRNYDISAAATIAGWELRPQQQELAESQAFYDLRRMSVPYLIIYRTDDSLIDPSFGERCRYSDRTMLGLSGLAPTDLSSGAAFAAVMADSAELVSNIQRPKYDYLCRQLGYFFAARLQSDSASMTLIGQAEPAAGLAGKAISLATAAGLELPPTAQEFANIVQTGGVSIAREVYEKFATSDPGAITFDEAAFNMLGYQTMQRGQAADACWLFRLNAEANPNSANCFDSWADGCLAAGDTAQAIVCYETVLKVLPNDTALPEGTRAVVEQNALRGLETLKQ